jgi:carbon storage regulator
MLVLTRRVGETIRIGDDISIRVVDIQRGQVRFAIDAPRDIPVHREEIYRLVQEENRAAAASTKGVDPTKIWRGAKADES